MEPEGIVGQVLSPKSSATNELTSGSCSDHPSSSLVDLQMCAQEWETLPDVSCGVVTESHLGKIDHFTDCIKLSNGVDKKVDQSTVKIEQWDAKAMLDNLQYLDQKIHQLQNMVQLIVGQKNEVSGQSDDFLAQQQRQQVATDLTSVIIQLISTAGSLLPSVANTMNLPSSAIKPLVGAPFQSTIEIKASGVSDSLAKSVTSVEEQELKNEDEVEDGDILPPGSFEILQIEKEEILALHTHFCTICGKGFKRDANLRMHMRGHGDEYKTPAALAKPTKESTCESVVKRYSCPFAGCKRNKNHNKFQPLKTILCVKNHYKRTHCSKSYVCSRCNSKKFSVIADLKTHEKHCGKDKWLCSCGTTFSRKDKLFGHIALFQGHAPAIPSDDKGSVSLSGKDDFLDSSNNEYAVNLGFNSSAFDGDEIRTIMEGNVCADVSTDYFSPLNFDPCNFDGFHDLTSHPFGGSETSLFPFV